ncbi:ABC transporter ATP-binding protein [Shewanella sp. WXL01]|uniref:ATP-binding cassette domain-containing protein n=1 Tax=Shewanella sp. WXL01 TaxID=2709721 RepID=UPI0014385EEB|nr:ATP-binding cassette domain-containing protein [Shewanella sp. WXL01]NKF51468.1 ABC transporter ATP-binding protein [Shewanella sp. WXL01]
MFKLNQSSIASTNKQLLVAPISFEVNINNPVCIIGETGAGKSLILQAIMGCLPTGLIRRGTIAFDGVALSDKQLAALWGPSISLLPQEPVTLLDPLMVNYQQLSEIHSCLNGIGRRAAVSLSLEQMQDAGLISAYDKYPRHLSGGMAQRLAYLCATTNNSRLLLLDEPTKGLDDGCCKRLYANLNAYGAQAGLICVTHDLNLVKAIGGKVLVIKQGLLIESINAATIELDASHEFTKSLIQANPKHWRADVNHRAKPLQVFPSAKGNDVSRQDDERITVIQAKKLQVGRAQRAIIKPIDFTIYKRQIIGLAGDSGVGKTTLGDTLLGLIVPIAGELQVAHKDKARWLKLYQDPISSFEPSYSIRVQLQDLTSLAHVKSYEVQTLLPKLNLSASLLDKLPSQLSGGELQRLALLRLMLLKPEFIFADEAVSRLDPITAKQVMQLLVSFVRESDITLVIVSHDGELLNAVCDDTLELQKVELQKV